MEATEKQLNLIESLLRETGLEGYYEYDPENLSKRGASELIDELMEEKKKMEA